MIKSNTINQQLATIDPVQLPVFMSKGIQVSMLRIDKIHPVISGNKWYKLSYYLADAIEQKKVRVLTYGGAWSNHIVATASACKELGLQSIGIIRGEEPSNYSNTLLEAKKFGMQLIFVSREDFSNKKISNELLDESTYEISEGGYGELGARGASDILQLIKNESYTHLACAVGTGTMLAGLTSRSLSETKIIGISVLKNNHSLEAEVKKLCPTRTNWSLLHGFDQGGYAKHSKELIEFMNEFYLQTSIPTDFVYTGKLIYAVHQLASADYFPKGSKLILIHSGGLQGNQSLTKGLLAY